MRSVSCFLAIVLAAVLLCACGAKDEPRASVESVVQENWPQFSDAEYDETAGTLRLTQESTMTYASAQKFGGEVYKDDLSLESYLDIVGVISYDVRSACGLQELTVTLEGVSKDGQPDVVQQAFMDAGAVQCGFCIPGMILTAEAFLKKNPNPTRDEVKLAISGNLCRCTGYAKINDAVLLAAARMRGEEAEA